MKVSIQEVRLKIPTLLQGGQVFLRQIGHSQAHSVALLIHGLGCTSDSFIDAECGLANYLAEHDICCYVPDLIGHGQSWPRLSRHFTHSIHNVIAVDILRLVNEIERQLNGRPLYLIGQGFGSILLLSAYARHKNLRSLCSGFIHFDPKRTGHSDHPLSRAQALLEHSILPTLGRIRGTVPLHWTREGHVPESQQWFETALQWQQGDWIDSVDYFDYGAQLASLPIPRSLYLTSSHAWSLGRTKDIRRLIKELSAHDTQLSVLDPKGQKMTKAQMVKSAQARASVFPSVVKWINRPESDEFSS